MGRSTLFDSDSSFLAYYPTHTHTSIKGRGHIIIDGLNLISQCTNTYVLTYCVVLLLSPKLHINRNEMVLIAGVEWIPEGKNKC